MARRWAGGCAGHLTRKKVHSEQEKREEEFRKKVRASPQTCGLGLNGPTPPSSALELNGLTVMLALGLHGLTPGPAA